MKKTLLALAFATTGMAAQAQTFTNASFETWRANAAGTSRPRAVQAPTSWNGADSTIIALGQFWGGVFGIPDTVWQTQVFPDSNTSHTGRFSAKLVTKDQDTLGITAGVLSNAQANVAISLSGFGGITYYGGTAMTQKPLTVSSWVKYAPANLLDSGFMYVEAISRTWGRDSVVGKVEVRVGGNDAAFRQITGVISYISFPWFNVDVLRVTFGSSIGANRTVNSVMYVDDVTMTSQPQFVSAQVRENNEVKVYPNPATSVLTFSPTVKGEYSVQLLNAAGQIVRSLELESKTALDVTGLPAGQYFYVIKRNDVDKVMTGSVMIGQ